MSKVVIILVSVLLAVTLLAAPRSLEAQGPVKVIQLPGFHNQQLLDRDAAQRARAGALDPIPLQFAEPITLTNVSAQTHGLWSTSGTRQTWQLEITSPGALSLNLGLNYHMPEGGRLVIYPHGQPLQQVVFTANDNEPHGQLWTPIINGDHLIMAVTLPKGVTPEQLQLEIIQANHGYRDLSQPVPEKSGSCNVDVVCPVAAPWQDQVQSVGVYSVGGTSLCTGALVNNTAQDFTPYFLSANHCGVNSGNAASVVVYWNHQNSICRQPGSPDSSGPGDGQFNQFNSGAIYRAGFLTSDFALIELDDPIQPDHQPFFAGWDRTNIAPVSAVAIHHPQAQEKRISFENDPTSVEGYGGAGGNSHVKVPDWDLGTTEPGSSGSPLFNPAGQIIGQLHGGSAACGNDLSDWYGRLYTSWIGGGTTETGLATWLDPLGLGSPAIDGTEYGSGAVVGTVIDPQSQLLADVTISVGGLTDLSNAAGQFSLTGILSGSHQLTAVKYGYQDHQQPVTVTDGQTTTVNLSLQTAEAYTLSGVVTDADTGWPLLPAITAQPGSRALSQDTGTYSATLATGITHTITFGAPGYLPVSHTVYLTQDQILNVTLEVDGLACNAPGYTGGDRQLLLSEDFEGAWPPPSWSVVNPVSNGNPDCVWVPASSGNFTGGSGNFAIANSDACGVGTQMHTLLVSPRLVTNTNLAFLEVVFNSDMRHYISDQYTFFTIDDDLITHTLMDRSGRDYPGPEQITLTGPASLGTRGVWEYHGHYDWWWQIDQVKFYSIAPCEASGSGFIQGEVTSGYDQSTIAGAMVSISNQTDNFTMVTNQHGLYFQIVPTGGYQLSIAAANHLTHTQVITVSLGQVTHVDAELSPIPAPTTYDLYLPVVVK
jgi:hypothetical protein